MGKGEFAHLLMIWMNKGSKKPPDDDVFQSPLRLSLREFHELLLRHTCLFQDTKKGSLRDVLTAMNRNNNRTLLSKQDVVAANDSIDYKSHFN